MINNPKLEDKIETKFNLNKLKTLSFGNLEGERDVMLKECFFPTYAIEKHLNSPVNYILSPKGAGKSALFRTLNNKYIHNIIFQLFKLFNNIH